jgi:MraZ protein
VVKSGKKLYNFVWMNNLIGSYECKLDDKGRLPLPIGIKKLLEESISRGFVLKRSVFQPCLELYPLEEWEKVMLKINALNRFKKKNNDFIRIFTAGVKPIEIDKVGRIQISKDLLAYARLEKEIVLSSAINIIEIWDKEAYETTILSQVENFAVLAEEVMGNTESENELS